MRFARAFFLTLVALLAIGVVLLITGVMAWVNVPWLVLMAVVVSTGAGFTHAKDRSD